MDTVKDRSEAPHGPGTFTRSQRETQSTGNGPDARAGADRSDAVRLHELLPGHEQPLHDSGDTATGQEQRQLLPGLEAD